MTDYRASLQNKLDKLEEQLKKVVEKLKKVEEERKRILSAIDVLDEIDSDTSSSGNSRSGARRGTITHAILSCLESSEEMLTTREIYDHVTQERTVSRPVFQTALHRLRKYSKIFKEDNLWGLAGYEYTNESESTDHEDLASKVTSPIGKLPTIEIGKLMKT